LGKRRDRMKRAARIGFVTCLLGLTIACGQTEIPPTLVFETGCLTSSGDEFILTDLESAGGRSQEPGPVTEAYLLKGADDELAEHVGRRVHVTGEASSPRIVNIRLLEPLVRARPAQGAIHADSSTGVDPTIEITQKVRLEVSHLLVRAVNPADASCVTL
jgi:hypothetical protein